MPNLTKKVKKPSIIDRGDSSDISDSDSDEDAQFVNDIVNVDFDVRAPQIDDEAGIKMLLQQLYLGSQISTSVLTEEILKNNEIGNVIACVEPEDDGPEDMEYGDVNTIMGINTIVNLRSNQQLKTEFSTFLTKKSSEEGVTISLGNVTELKNLLDSNNFGVLINERVLNCPPTIVHPCFQQLEDDIKAFNREKTGNNLFNIEKVLYICKGYVPNDRTTGGHPKVEYSFIENETIEDKATFVMSYICREQDGASDEKWGSSNTKLDACRTVMVLNINDLWKCKSEFSRLFGTVYIQRMDVDE